MDIARLPVPVDKVLSAGRSHLPGHVQNFGVLVVLAPDLTILQVSENVCYLCGQQAEELLGRGAAELFGPAEREALRVAMLSGSIEAHPTQLATGAVGQRGPFELVAHTFEGLLYVECEPHQPDRAQPESYWMVKEILDRFRMAGDLADYGQKVCAEIMRLTGFDRVTMARYHPEPAILAEVIGSQDRREPSGPLRLDIPEQTRHMYRQNGVRIMPDVAYRPSQMVPAINPLTSRPLEMTHCALRGFAKPYVQELRKGGARASMSLAIWNGGQLWGTIVCQHQTPWLVPAHIRAACEVISEVVSLQIGDKERRAFALKQTRATQDYGSLVDRLAPANPTRLVGLVDWLALLPSVEEPLLSVRAPDCARCGFPNKALCGSSGLGRRFATFNRLLPERSAPSLWALPIVASPPPLLSTAESTCATAWSDMAERVKADDHQLLSLERTGNIATALQSSLLERPDDEYFEGLRFHTVYAPALEEAEVGGDFYDALKLPDGRVALIVGDISGKGLDSARHVAEVKYTLRAYLNQGMSVSESLRRLNLDLYDGPKNLFAPDKLCCLVAFTLEAKTGALEVVSAGMEAALILRQNGAVQLLDECSSPALNVHRDAEFAVACYQLDLGDLLLGFTDGLTEARVQTNGFLGYEGLSELLQTEASKTHDLTRLGQAILDSVRALGGGQLRDDFCLLLAHLRP